LLAAAAQEALRAAQEATAQWQLMAALVAPLLLYLLLHQSTTPAALLRAAEVGVVAALETVLALEAVEPAAAAAVRELTLARAAVTAALLAQLQRAVLAALVPLTAAMAVMAVVEVLLVTQGRRGMPEDIPALEAQQVFAPPLAQTH
jgi:hypothetical protein